MEQSKFYQIKNITEHEYTLVGCDGSVITRKIEDIDKSASSFTIQDAKDGDVVADKSDGTIGIFQSIGHHPDGGSYNDPSYCFLHCRYDDGYFFADFEDGNMMTSDDVIPAIKEQSDLLFTKMKEAGYEWNVEKKELKKIEDDGVEYKKHIMSELVNLAIAGVKQKSKPTWSEDDEKMLGSILEDVDYVGEFPDYPTKLDCELKDESNAKIKWLESLKDRVQPQPKQEWSDEDDAYKLFAISAVEDYYDEENPLQKAIVDWLKSLKDRITWKPSKEQLDALIRVMVESGFNYINHNTLESLYNDLKKL